MSIEVAQLCRAEYGHKWDVHTVYVKELGHVKADQPHAGAPVLSVFTLEGVGRDIGYSVTVIVEEGRIIEVNPLLPEWVKV